MGIKAIIFYISRVVNYSYEFHFDQNRGLPELEINSHFMHLPVFTGMHPTALCTQGGTSPAITTYCSTNLSADGCGSAQAINPDLPGRVSMCNGICVCAAQRLI